MNETLYLELLVRLNEIDWSREDTEQDEDDEESES